MNMKIKEITTYIILFLLFIAVRANATQLSGTYTINPSASVTTTNFHNFYSAIAFMTGGTRNDSGTNNTSPFGISGSVIFTVAAGIYSEQVNLTTTITGISPVNTIIFDGGNGNAATRIITYGGVGQTIIINNSPYLTFRNLTINETNTSSGTRGILIYGTYSGASNCCRISRCNINLATISSIGIYATAIRIDSLMIDSNIINGCNTGINISQAGVTFYQNKIISNQILNGGIVFGYQSGIQVLNNTVSANISAASSTNNGANSVIISGNKINNGTLSVSGINSSGVKGIITNNMITNSTGTSANCLSLSGNYWSVANNSMNYTAVATAYTYSPLYVSGIGISIINNLSQVKQNTNPALPLYVNSTSYIDTMDYNVFYRTDTFDHYLIYINGVYYNSGSFIGAGGFNTHSKYLNPGFVNDSNLHISIPCLVGTSLPYVTNDIDGNARYSKPSIGACEVQRLTNDIGTDKIISPSVTSISTGSNSVSARFKNYGSNTVTSFNYSYQLNSNTPVTLYTTSTLNSCDTLSLTFSTPVSIASAPGTLKVYTSNPNSSTDANMLNDTIIFTFSSLTPVKLIDFTANRINENVVLNWQTASELNNDYFEIHRSVPSAQCSVNCWEVVGKVKGNGTSNVVNSYQFIDNISNIQPLTSNLYYRLRQVDFDGKSTLSEIRVININQPTSNWNIYPNPTSNDLHIETTTNEKLNVQLFDVTGKQIMESILLTNTTNINTSSLNEGMYFVRITNVDGVDVKTQKVAVVR